MFTLEWSTSSRLKDVMHQFQKHLDYLQEFWSVLDNIDKSLCVVDVKQPARASAIRRIDAGNDCIIIVHIDFKDPKSLPEQVPVYWSCAFSYAYEQLAYVMEKKLQKMVK